MTEDLIMQSCYGQRMVLNVDLVYIRFPHKINILFSLVLTAISTFLSLLLSRTVLSDLIASLYRANSELLS